MNSVKVMPIKAEPKQWEANPKPRAVAEVPGPEAVMAEKDVIGGVQGKRAPMGEPRWPVGEGMKSVAAEAAANLHSAAGAAGVLSRNG